MISSINDFTLLKNGVKMPWLGLGTWQVEDGSEVINSVRWAIQNGYRHIDTAAAYYNEIGVGTAIKGSGIPREELFITTKVWNSDQGYDTTLRAFSLSRKKLGLDYVDLYLIHWPVRGKYRETWKALEKIYKDGLTRAIGVSNFNIHHLKDVMADSEIIPMVNQVEFHPLLNQNELRAFCRENGIQFEAWSPLMQGHFNIPVLSEIAKKHGKTPAQVLLRWDLQNEVVTIPKSTHEERIKENKDIFDFELSKEEMDKIDGMDKGRRFGSDPENFNF